MPVTSLLSSLTAWAKGHRAPESVGAGQPERVFGDEVQDHLLGDRTHVEHAPSPEIGRKPVLVGDAIAAVNGNRASSASRQAEAPRYLAMLANSPTSAPESQSSQARAVIDWAAYRWMCAAATGERSPDVRRSVDPIPAAGWRRRPPSWGHSARRRCRLHWSGCVRC
jgi:hypothetical protein